jgi:hypothetical protein
VEVIFNHHEVIIQLVIIKFFRVKLFTGQLSIPLTRDLTGSGKHLEVKPERGIVKLHDVLCNLSTDVTCDADWVKSITPDTKTWAEYDITVLKVVCDPLPEGVSGRKCELHVQSKTCKSTYPIEVLQGDATAGINGVTVNVARDGKTYNLIEQRKAKGVAIDPNEPLVRQAGLSESSLQRYKGLGEMDAEQLWETTMNPDNRVLVQVKVEDAEKADAIFTKLMGDEVELRKNFIQTRAKFVKHEDLDV